MDLGDGWHTCHFCGQEVKDGYEDEAKTKRHWLSDCRPDLVEHEIGEICTWAYRRDPTYNINPHTQEPYPENSTCYAYQSTEESPPYKTIWTNEHTHFYPDGPM